MSLKVPFENFRKKIIDFHLCVETKNRKQIQRKETRIPAVVIATKRREQNVARMYKLASVSIKKIL